MPTAPNFVLFIGRLHPLLVHLPIGFLLLLGIVELLSRFPKFRGAAAARNVILAATVVSAVITIICGLMLSTSGDYDPSLLSWHKWMGILLGLSIFASAFCVWQKQPRLYTAFLIASLVILAPASHFGASITHGKNYLFAYAPMWLRPASDVPVATVANAQPVQAVAQADVYTDLVKPVLEQNCVACHNADKTSGQLRLDSVASILKGGHSGPAIITKNSVGSLLIQRISLAAQDAKHMPPDGKPQPSDDQIDLLKWWIDNGSPQNAKVADLNPNDDQLAMVKRLLKLPETVDPSAAPPIAIGDAQSQIAVLSPRLGIVFTPFAVDRPWVIVNAAINHSFNDSQLAELSPLSANIVDLNLAGTLITDAGLTTVATMSNLTRLRLDRTAITDAGLAKLTQLKKLTYLNLYGTRITDNALKTLAALPNLRHLYLYQTKVDPAAAAAFAASKTDPTKIARLKKQIEKLQEQLSGSSVDVVEGIKPTTRPAEKQ
jgi:uncharacterized membrane protein